MFMPAKPLIAQIGLHLLELAPFELAFNGCRGIKGPVPPPLFIRVLKLCIHL